MSLLLIPDSALSENNPCHNPPGKGGGQFCSKKSAGGVVDGGSKPEAPTAANVKRGWHLTSNPTFAPDPAFKPELNSLAGDLMGDNRPAGLFVTEQPEFWMQAHGYERPYVAQVEGTVTNPRGSTMYGPTREEFMQGEMKTVRVLTIDEYAREVYGEAGWVEDFHGEGPKRGTIPKNYVGRPVSDMTPAEIRQYEKKFAAWQKRSR
jgi:hypothetical protein